MVGYTGHTRRHLQIPPNVVTVWDCRASDGLSCIAIRHLAKLKCSILSFSVFTNGGRRCIQVGANGIDER